MNPLHPFLIAAIVGTLPAQDQVDTRAQFAKIAQEIEAQRVQRGAPSIAVAVARHGEILWEGAFGWADREAKVRATPQTIYALASVSKPITATGLMRLVEQGALDLDGSVNDYLRAAQLTARLGDADDATIRTLANHTSGLGKHYNLFFDDEIHRPISRVESIGRWGVLMSVPGERHEYSNFGYGILDYVIERVSGMPFGEFMEKEVFELLGMESSFVGRPDGVGDRLAVRYMPDGARFPPASSAESGGGSIYSSVHDLVRFGMFHLEDQVSDQSLLSEASIDEMHRATTVAHLSFNDVGYGVGWRSWRSDRGGFLVVQHTGLMEGATASLTLVPEEGLVIAALVNEAGFLATAALDIVGRELLGVRNLDAPRREPQSRSTAGDLWSELAGDWRGFVNAYNGDVPIEVVIGPEHTMRVRFDDQPWADAKSLVLRGNTLSGTFRGEQKADVEWRRWPTNITLTFRKDEDRITATMFADAVSDPVKGVPFGFTLWVAVERADGERADGR